MAITGITRAGEAYVNVTCEDQELKDGLAEVSETIREFANKNSTVNLSFLNAAALKAGSVAIKSAIDSAVFSMRDYGVGVADMSSNTGLMTETISTLSYAAQSVGVELRSVEAAVTNLNTALATVSTSSGVAAALKEIGLSFSEFKSFDPDKQFKMIVTSLAGLEDTSKRAAVGVALFGNEWQRIAPLMSGGEAGIRRAADEAKKMGLVISEEQAKQAKDVEQASARQKAAWQGLQVTLGSNYTLLAEKASNATTGVFRALTDVAKQSPRTAQGIGVAASALTGATAAANGLRYATTVLVPAFSTLGKAITIMAANPVLTSIGLLGAGIAALGIYSLSSKQHVADLSDEMKGLLDEKAKQFAADAQQMERLQELADKQNRSNDELAEAATIAQTLQNTYGELGIGVDTFTNKITIAAGAQDKLNEKMRGAYMIQLEEARIEARKNLRELDAEYASLSSAPAWKMFIPGSNPEKEAQEQNVVEIQENLKRAALEREKLKSIDQRIAELNSGTEYNPADDTPKNKGDIRLAPPGSNPLKYIEEYRTEQKPESVREIEKIVSKNAIEKSAVDAEIENERSKGPLERNDQRVGDLRRMGSEVDAALQDRLLEAIGNVAPRGGQSVVSGLTELAAASAAAKRGYQEEIDAITKANPNLEANTAESRRVAALEKRISEIDTAAETRQMKMLIDAQENGESPAARELARILAENQRATETARQQLAAESQKPEEERDQTTIKRLTETIEKAEKEKIEKLQALLEAAKTDETKTADKQVEQLEKVYSDVLVVLKNDAEKRSAANKGAQEDSEEVPVLEDILKTLEDIKRKREEEIREDAQKPKNKPPTENLSAYDDPQRALDNARIVEAQRALHTAVTELYQARYSGGQTPEQEQKVRDAEALVERARATRAENVTIDLGKQLDAAAGKYQSAVDKYNTEIENKKKLADTQTKIDAENKKPPLERDYIELQKLTTELAELTAKVKAADPESKQNLLRSVRDLETIKTQYAGAINELQSFNSATPEHNEQLGKSLYDSLGELQSQTTGTFSAFDTERLENSSWSKIEDNTRESANWLRELYYKKDENTALYSE